MSTTHTTTTVQAPPTLTVKLDEKTVPMTVHSLRIDVHIAAAVSRTTLIVTLRGNLPVRFRRERRFAVMAWTLMAKW
jgi:hypothetical protein